MAGTDTEVVLNKSARPELVQLFFNTEADTGAPISTIAAEVKELRS